MAKVQPSLSFESFSGRLSRKERIVMRTRNGRTHAYAIIFDSLTTLFMQAR